ncbi:MAG TPA: TerB family tellurite resistance protein [Pseudomonadaceae bacterium]|nr:TerB family tellurite resistance protein [Pseudomonadaceae bacterium]
MIRGITRFFESCLKPAERENAPETAHRLQLAAAALLVELCCSDQDFSNEEMHLLKQILREQHGLSDDELDTLWKLAREEVSNATSLFQFTSLINEHYDRPARLALLESMWRVAFADGRIDRYEDYTIRKVADLLYLSHADFIRCKHAARAAGAGNDA